MRRGQKEKEPADFDHDLGTVVNATDGAAQGRGGRQAQRVMVSWKGRQFAMVRYRDGFRLRVRRKWMQADVYVGVSDAALARKLVRARLEAMEREAEGRERMRGKGSLQEVADVYVTLPLRCSARSARGNVRRLAAVVRTAWGKELREVPVARVPELWPAYVAARQGSQRPDYNTRRKENRGINAAMRLARCLFLRKLRKGYEAAGIVIPEGAEDVTWLPEPALSRAPADDAGMMEAWEGLREVDADLWVVIGLARFAGLRLGEILALRGKWVQGLPGGGAKVVVCDRPEDGWWCKTGKLYAPLVWHPEVAEYLLALRPEQPAIARPSPARWAAHEPQRWLRQWMPDARLPLHRLRGLYAQQVLRETEEAVLARRAGLKAASEALGHTSPRTTEAHYVD